ncbi:hypothetical protein D3C75_1197270 [compost metagenome]
MQVAIGHPAIPHLDAASLKTQAKQCRTTEHVHRQNTLELGVHFPKGLRHAVALGRHAIKHFGQWHGADRGRQTMTGEIPQEQAHVARGRQGRQ